MGVAARPIELGVATREANDVDGGVASGGGDGCCSEIGGKGRLELREPPPPSGSSIGVVGEAVGVTGES